MLITSEMDHTTAYRQNGINVASVIRLQVAQLITNTGGCTLHEY